MSNSRRQLGIVQANCWKSAPVMTHLFGEEQVRNSGILAIQEPWVNRHGTQMVTYSQALGGRFHQAIKPVPSSGLAPRVCFFVSKRIDPKTWTVRHCSRFLSTLTLRGVPEVGPVHIHNIYIPGKGSDQREIDADEHENEDGDPSEDLEEEQQNPVLDLLEIALQEPGEHLVLGDFNLHHPLWNPPGYGHTDAKSERLLDIATGRDLGILLPEGAITYEKGTARTTIDLTWATPRLGERLSYCSPKRNWWLGKDHIPIQTILDLSPAPASAVKRWDWDGTDWQAYRQVLTQQLRPLSCQLIRPVTIDEAVEGLVAALTEAAHATTPIRTITGFSRPGYTEAMKELKRHVQQTRRWAKSGREEDRRAYSRARNKLYRATAKLKRELHRKRIEDGGRSIEGFWRLAKWARTRGDPRPTYTPALKAPTGEFIDDPEAKAKLFQQALFPAVGTAELTDIDNYQYPEPHTMPRVSMEEIRRAIRQAAPKKAPGPDGLPNLVLQQTLPLIEKRLHIIFNACLDIGYCPQHFRRSTTVVLRKPGKDDYTVPKSYRPIALLSTIGKALESIVASRISYLVEKYTLLPEHHIGGRRGRSCDHALHLIHEQVHAAWRSGCPVASLLAVDTQGAYDNVNHPRLLHNLRKRRIPTKIVDWIASFLANRRTAIALQEGTMEENDVQCGIAQGSPLSPILYLFYNADLLELPGLGYRSMIVGYVDDICILVWGDTIPENYYRLRLLHSGAETWQRKHASVFSPSKYGLINMVRQLPGSTRRNPADMRLTETLHIAGTEIRPTESLRYLGVYLDPGLSGSAHLSQLEAKATRLMAALSSIAGSTWGMSALNLRRIYTAVLLPQLLFGCSTWFIRGARGYQKTAADIVKRLESIQHKVLCRVAGAFRTTSRAALEVCFYIPPPQVSMKRATEDSCLRIMASPLYRKRRQDPETNPAMSPLHRLERRLARDLGMDPDIPLPIETIEPIVTPPWWHPPDSVIAESRDAAIEEHGRLQPNTTFLAYTDGSGYNGGIGAAAVLRRKSCIYPLGRDTTHTVYSAELAGIELALGLAEAENPIRSTLATDKPRDLVVLTDNQAAIRACVEPRRQSGQAHVKRIVQQVDRMRQTGWKIRLQWLPGHEGIPGNELADERAKEAARRATNAPINGMLVSATKQRLQTLADRSWAIQWQNNAHGHHARRIIASPSKRILQLHTGLHRAWSSALVQMQTGKIALGAYLGTIGVTETTCPCGWGPQSVKHVLMECPRHERLRWSLLWAKGRLTDFRRALNGPPELVKQTIKYILHTGLLGQFRNLNAHILDKAPGAQC